MHREKSAAGPLALCYAALIVYATLFPFTGWRDQGLPPWAYLHAPLPQYWTRFDLLANFAGYAPLGFLLALALLPAWGAWRAVALAALGPALLSFGLEALQSYLPLRVASNLDLALNAAGGAAGALVAVVLERLGAIGRWRRFRRRWFVPEARGVLVLLALWPVALLYPAPVAFGLGQVYERAETALAALLKGTPFLEWLPLREVELQPLLPGVEVLCVALGVLAPCLLGYSVMLHTGRRALLAALALAVGVAASALSAALTWGPVYAWAWLDRPQRWGLMAGAGLALLALPLPRRACVPVLMATLALGLALLNQAPESAYDAANLQVWEQGRFIHFYGLAQWVGWLWPYAALLYLAGRLLRRGPAQAPALPTISA
ncbi:MAG: VanZ family protein [Comamonadaceae bacterium]|nr:VanZ family protein [Comamonadaceae bacterium]